MSKTRKINSKGKTFSNSRDLKSSKGRRLKYWVIIRGGLYLFAKGGGGQISICARKAQNYFAPTVKFLPPPVRGQSYNRGGANICYLHSS